MNEILLKSLFALNKTFAKNFTKKICYFQVSAACKKAVSSFPFKNESNRSNLFLTNKNNEILCKKYFASQATKISTRANNENFETAPATKTKNFEDRSTNTVHSRPGSINLTVKNAEMESNETLIKQRKEIGFETESILDNEWKEIKTECKKLPFNYSKLSKKNLTALVVATTMMGCAMAPLAFDPYIFAYTTLGTTLTSASANTINQFLEVPYDSQMNRTKDRVLVRGNLTPLHAFTFASLCGMVGLSTLYFLVNPLTAALGASSLILYTAVYTPMKRLSALNTWVGSVVGAIPPLMGYTAMTGMIDPAGILLAVILYSWQFPHFHALSWNLRAEYSRAGYRMVSVINPRVCTSSALSHTLALTFICSYLAPVFELTTWNFAIDSLPFNLYFVYLAYMFKKNGDANSSRKLFRYSLAYLPFVILLMLITKFPIGEHTMPVVNSEENRKLALDRLVLLNFGLNKKKLSGEGGDGKASVSV